MSLSWWWNPVVQHIGRDFSRNRVAALHRAGLRRYKDVWKYGRLMHAEEIRLAYGLLREEFGV